jgi:Na+-transporting methylmalonyl-CoA/oxaloacetate decarboxylase gamma subunit
MSIDLALSLLIALINNAASVSALITKAKGENRDVTTAELQALLDTDAVERARLVIAIAAAKAAGK